MKPLHQLCCQNSRCPRYGQRGQGNLSACGWIDRRKTIRPIYGSACKARFSERKGTPLYQAQLPTGKGIALWDHVRDGGGVRQTGRRVGVSKNTAKRSWRSMDRPIRAAASIGSDANPSRAVVHRRDCCTRRSTNTADGAGWCASARESSMDAGRTCKRPGVVRRAAATSMSPLSSGTMARTGIRMLVRSGGRTDFPRTGTSIRPQPISLRIATTSAGRSGRSGDKEPRAPGARPALQPWPPVWRITSGPWKNGSPCPR